MVKIFILSHELHDSIGFIICGHNTVNTTDIFSRFFKIKEVKKSRPNITKESYKQMKITRWTKSYSRMMYPAHYNWTIGEKAELLKILIHYYLKHN